MDSAEPSPFNLHDALEALRPGHDDLAAAPMEPLAHAIAEDEQLAALHERLQRIDAMVIEALHDVAVPSGLAERLFAALAAADASAPTLAAAESPRRRRLGRRAFASGLALSVTVAALTGYMLWPAPTPELGPEAILFAALERPLPPLESTHALADEQPSDDFLPPISVVMTAATRWHTDGDGFLGRGAVSYDLAPPGQPRAVLYVTVAGRHAPRLAMIPQAPLERVLETGGQAATTWTDGSRLFVLVVEGDARDLSRHLHAPGSMAWLPRAEKPRS